jgi:hypothetical protein
MRARNTDDATGKKMPTEIGILKASFAKEGFNPLFGPVEN